MATAYKKVLAALLGSALLLGASSAFADRSSYVEGPVTDEKTAGDVTAKSWYVEGLVSMIDSTKSDFSFEDKVGLSLVVGKNFHKYFAAEIIAGSGIVDQQLGLVLKPNIQISDRVQVYLDLGFIQTQDQAYGSCSPFPCPRSQSLYGIGADIDFADSAYCTIGVTRTDGDGVNDSGIQLGVGFRF